MKKPLLGVLPLAAGMTVLSVALGTPTARAVQLAPGQVVTGLPSTYISDNGSSRSNASQPGAATQVAATLASGRIAAVDMAAGSLLVNGHRLQWDSARLRVFHLPAGSVGSVSDLRPGQRIRFAVDSGGDPRAPGRVILVYVEAAR